MKSRHVLDGLIAVLKDRLKKKEFMRPRRVSDKHLQGFLLRKSTDPRGL